MRAHPKGRNVKTHDADDDVGIIIRRSRRFLLRLPRHRWSQRPRCGVFFIDAPPAPFDIDDFYRLDPSPSSRGWNERTHRGVAATNASRSTGIAVRSGGFWFAKPLES